LHRILTRAVAQLPPPITAIFCCCSDIYSSTKIKNKF
jgi:hypothetical protein